VPHSSIPNKAKDYPMNLLLNRSGLKIHPVLSPTFQRTTGSNSRGSPANDRSDANDEKIFCA